MRWTMGLVLLASAGCGYHQTRMVACPDTGCGNQYAARSSPQGLASPYEPAQPTRTEDQPIYRAQSSVPVPTTTAPPLDVPSDEGLPTPSP